MEEGRRSSSELAGVEDNRRLGKAPNGQFLLLTPRLRSPILSKSRAPAQMNQARPPKNRVPSARLMHRKPILHIACRAFPVPLFIAVGSLWAGPAEPTPFDVLDADFQGEDKALVWTARVRDTLEAAGDPYTVTRAYGGQLLQKPPLERDEQVLYRAELGLPDGKRGSISLRKQVRPSVEARADAPVRILYTFHLEVGLRLHIKREHSVAVKALPRRADDDRSILNSLEGDARKVALALAENDTTELDTTRLVQLAVWLLTSERPLGRPVKQLQLKKCRADINEKTLELPIVRNSLGNLVLRLPAGPRSRIMLRPDVHIREFTAYSNTVVIKQRPLPSYGFLKLSQPGTSMRLFGRAVEPPGTFEVGPLQPTGLRRLELSAAFPLEPPGENPRLRAEILFRSGRPIEAFLDRGELPPLPTVPKYLSQRAVVPFLVKMAAAAVNPDSGSMHGVGYRQLVDLYAIAFEAIQENNDLLAIAEQALLKDIARRSWTYPRRALSSGVGWTAEDAEIALTYPALAGELEAKIREESEPRRWVATDKARPARKQPDTVSAGPHAMAIAGLSRNPAFRAVITAQLTHLEGHEQQRRVSGWTTDELALTAQPMKFAAAHLKDETLRRRVRALLGMLRAESQRRFTARGATLALADRIQLAHIISPIWRPYLGTPPRLLVDSMDIDPSGSATGPRGGALEEASLRFRAALQREVQELRPRKLPAEEKARRIDALAARWFAYIQRSQGRLPDDLRRELEGHQKQARTSLARE